MCFLLAYGNLLDFFFSFFLFFLYWEEGGRGEGETRNVTIVTWLILPVVICLSQRLSHACLSINTLYCETAYGSLNQL